MKRSAFVGLRKLYAVAGGLCLVIGVLATLGWLLRDVLGFELGFQGSFFPFVLLTGVGAGFVVSSWREP